MKKPIVLVIMDGVGKGDGGSGDAVKVANTPNLDKLLAWMLQQPFCHSVHNNKLGFGVPTIIDERYTNHGHSSSNPNKFLSISLG